MYRRIHESFWTDENVKKLTPDERYLFLYLITTRHQHMCGLSNIPKLYICYETGLDEPAVNRGLTALEAAGICRSTGGGDWLWVTEMARFQVTGSDQWVKVSKYLREIGDKPFTNEFKSKYSNQIKDKSTGGKPAANRRSTGGEPAAISEAVSETETDQDRARARAPLRAPRGAKKSKDGNGGSDRPLTPEEVKEKMAQLRTMIGTTAEPEVGSTTTTQNTVSIEGALDHENK